MAEVLHRVGRFAPDDVHLLLEPSPSEITDLLDAVGRETRSSTDETVFVFYYSVHSDGQAIFPHGVALPLPELRARITALGARLKLGILDTCRGGS